MKYRFFTFLLVVTVGFACSKCSSSKLINGSVALDKNHKMLVADSSKAAALIIIDDTDAIFGKMTEADMSIQMKKNYPSETFRTQIVGDYLTFLQEDVSSFSQEEAMYVKSTMSEIFDLCNKLSPNIFPKDLSILKTKGKHYGNGVYYTRENCIIVPANELAAKNKDAFFSTMIHEVFHVYSRQNPEKRKALYQLIGFNHLDNYTLDVPVPLKDRVLLNPDGVDFSYYINLQIAPDKEIKAVPIIYSKEATYKKSVPSFFNYLKFELFEVQPFDRGGYKVITKKDGSSTLNIKELPDFWRQIRDNTQYIIHPDEVLADNFMFLVKSLKDDTQVKSFSLEGKRLVEDMKKIVTQK